MIRRSHFALLPVLLLICNVLNAQVEDTTSQRIAVDSLLNTANGYIKKQDYEKAQAVLDIADTVTLQSLGEFTLQYARVCQLRGAINFYTKKINAAEEYYLKARTILEKSVGKNNLHYANIQENLANLYYNNTSQYEKAEQLFLETKDIRGKILGKEHPDYAKVLDALASMYSDQGKYDKAEPLALEALNIRAKVFGKEHQQYTWSLNTLAILYKNMGLYEKAEPLYLEALTIRKKNLGEEHPEYAVSLNNLGNFYWASGRYDKAEELYLKATALRKRILGKDHLEYASSLHNLAILYLTTGQYEKVEAPFLEVLAIVEKQMGKQHPRYATILVNLGIYYKVTGRFEKAELLYLEGLALLEKKVGKEHPDYASSLHNLAALYENMKQYNKAEQLYLEALTIRKKTVGIGHPDYATSLNSLAAMYSRTNQYQKAESYYLEAKEVRKKALGENSPQYASSLTSLGNLYNTKGQRKQAESLFLEARDIQAKVPGKESPGYASTLNNLAGLYLNMQQYDKAEPLYQEARAIREKNLGKENPEVAEIIGNLAVLYRMKGQYKKSESLFIESAQIDQVLIDKASKFLSETELQRYELSFANDVAKIFSFSYANQNKALEILKKDYDIALFYKNFLLDEGQRIKKYALSDSTATEQYNQLKSISRRLAKEYEKPAAKRDADKVAKLEAQSNDLEKELTRSMSGIAAARQQVTWQQVRDKLKPGEAAIEFIHFLYYRNDGHASDSIFYAAMLLRPQDEHPQFIFLCEQKQLDSLLSTPSSNLPADNIYATRNITPVQVANTKALYPLVWQPIENLLEGVNTIYYTPSGLLHRIAFHAIPTSKTNEVLADQYRMYQLGSTRSLATECNDVSNTAPVSALLMGGIQYNSRQSKPDSLTNSHIPREGDNSASLQNNDFMYLPGTKREVNEIEKLLNSKKIPVRVLSDTAATEEMIKTLGTPGNPAPSVLHLATHGFFFPDPAQKTPTSGQEGAFSLLEHPLLRSGLALAGANQAWKNGQPLPGREDGILTAYEISNLNLTGTQLAVLSACETGLGDIQDSEGVYGLQRAFKIAGVERLIVTLWDVPDKETAAFMSLFYEKWLNGGKDIRTAFYETQTAMRQRYKDPFVWAAFVLVE